MLVALATLLPLGYLVVRALGAGPQGWELLLRPRTMGVIANTLGLAAAVTLAALAIGLPLAWLQARTDLPWRPFWSVVTALPLAIPTYVLGFAYVSALGPRGTVQQVLASSFGVERLPEIYGFGGAALVLTLATFPYILLGARAAFQAVDSEAEEAARLLGGGAWMTFRRMTLPLIQPAVASGCLLVVLYVLSDFGGVSLLRFETLSWAVYLQYQGSFDRTLAAMFGLVLVAVAAVVVWGELMSRGRAAHYRLGAGAGYRRGPVSLGRWRYPALLFSSLVALLGLGLPLIVIVSWFGGAASIGVSAVLAPLWNTAGASLMAAAAATVASLPIGYLAIRERSAFVHLVQAATYLGYALPGIVIALALVFFGANFARPLYQTLGLLIFAYVVRFLPEAVGASRSSLSQVAPSLEDAARSLGRGHLGAFSDITLRLASPGILAGTLLVFLTAIKELPVTLLLSPTGFKTLATAVWASTAEARYADAAAPALVLILVSGAATALLASRELGRPIS